MNTNRSDCIKRIKYISLGFFLIFYMVKGASIINRSIDPYIVEALFDIIGQLAAFIIMFYGIKSNKIVYKRVWIYVSIAICLNIIGDIIGHLNKIIFHNELPAVSFRDIFYLPSALLLMIALFISLRKEHVYNIIKTIMDVGIVVTASMTLLYNYVILPIWQQETLFVYQKLILILYPFLDLGYLTGVFAYIFNKKLSKLNHLQSIYLILGFSLFFLADIMFSIDPHYSIDSVYNPFWTMGYICLAIASLYSQEHIPYNNLKLTNNEKKKDYRDYFAFLFPYITASVIIIAISARNMLNDPLAFGSTITLLFIILRQIFTLLENNRILDILEKTNLQLLEYSSSLENHNKKLNELKDRKETEAQTDYLTHLYNRRYICEWIEKYIDSFPKTTEIGFSVLLIDVDYYKEINDIFGHDIGDYVLQEVAAIIRDNIRGEDKAGRYGGDEFMVILPETKTEHAKLIADRILKAVDQNMFNNNPDMHITLSIGNYYWSGLKEQYSFNRMIKYVDKALYEAKNTGRNKIITK